MQLKLTNAEAYLESKASEYPYLAVRPFKSPDPMQMEQTIGFLLFGNWIAGNVKGQMHWRFQNPTDLETFNERYPDALSK